MYMTKNYLLTILISWVCFGVMAKEQNIIRGHVCDEEE